MLYGFSSSVSGENGIVNPLVSLVVIVALSDMMISISNVILVLSDVIIENIVEKW